jgi:hypothetical protein
MLGDLLATHFEREPGMDRCDQTESLMRQGYSDASIRGSRLVANQMFEGRWR